MIIETIIFCIVVVALLACAIREFIENNNEKLNKEEYATKEDYVNLKKDFDKFEDNIKTIVKIFNVVNDNQNNIAIRVEKWKPFMQIGSKSLAVGTLVGVDNDLEYLKLEDVNGKEFEVYLPKIYHVSKLSEEEQNEFDTERKKSIQSNVDSLNNKLKELS